MRITASELSRRLASDAERTCRWLIPHGKREAGQWLAGSVNGEKGRSLQIQLDGERAGLWLDRANGADSGDLLDLIRSTRNVDLRGAIILAKEHLGIHEPEAVLKRSFKPAKPTHVGKATPDSRVMAYLTGDRKIPSAILDQFKVRPSKDDDAYLLPRFNPDGTLANVKTVKLERDENGKKIEWQEKDCAPVMFGWPGVGNSREVIITEGELDALSYATHGFPALSVPNGATGLTWIEQEFDRLEQFDAITLSFDNDKPGQDAVLTVARRLGLHRCVNVVLPKFKDANAALQAGCDREFFEHALADAKPFTPVEIRQPRDFTEEVLGWFHPEGERGVGVFPPLFEDKIGFRPGELSIWTGISGHGKSVMLSQVMHEAMTVGERVAFASMEMPARVTLGRMIRQLEGCWHPAPEATEKHIGWLTGKLWLFNLLGNVTPDKLMELMDYALARYGCTHYVVDSLMKIGVASDDYDAQRRFCNGLSTFAIENSVHVHLVAHGRKLPNESTAPGKMDVKGSSDITNQADNVICVFRNHDKEAQRQDGVAVKATDPDAVVYCNKQRSTGWEGRFKLLYNWGNHTFYPCERKI
jgi:twinkle protein